MRAIPTLVAAMLLSGYTIPTNESAAAAAPTPTDAARQAKPPPGSAKPEQIAPVTRPAPATTVNQPAQPAPPPDAGKVLTDSVAILIQLFVLAVILESALAALFHWPPYLARFNARAANPLISFATALILVSWFDLDPVGALFKSYSPGLDPNDHWITRLVSAFVVAGGSAGVNRMLRALGFRAIDSEAQAPKPPPTKAWIAVINRSGTYPTPRDIAIKLDNGPWQTCGNVIGSTKARSLSWLLRDRRRFPGWGGYELAPGIPIAIAISEPGVPATDHDKVWGPQALAAAAIVDIVV